MFAHHPAQRSARTSADGPSRSTARCPAPASLAALLAALACGCASDSHASTAPGRDGSHAGTRTGGGADEAPDAEARAEAAPRQDTSAAEVGAERADGAGVDAALAAIRAGDYARALELVEGLAFDAAVARGRAELAGGSPRDALASFDEALELRPSDASAHFLRASAAFAAAEADPAAGFFYADAASGFTEAARAGHGVEAALLASRAARLAGDSQAALDTVRQAITWLDADPARRGKLDFEPPPERIWAEAAFDRYIAARSARDEAGEASGGDHAEALFRETEDALGRLAGERPADAWPHLQLAYLYARAGQPADAEARVATALKLDPSSEAAHDFLVRTVGDRAAAEATAAGGGEREAARARHDAVIARYEAFQRAHPENALGHWYAGYERFARALDEFDAGTREEDAFRAAERDFRRCRELAPAYRDACLGWEVICRDAIGWCRYWADDREGAEEAFLSTEELVPGGLDWQLEGRLPSSLAGLDFVIRKYAEASDDLESMTKAAAIADTMFARRPDQANLANNAGFLNRDAAVLYEAEARRARASASEAGDAETQDARRAEAARLRARAQSLIERSFAAYEVAARLAPDDVRIVNDAGLVMAYYLRTDPARARAYFLDAIEDGRAQLAAEDLGEERRAELTEAYGDAHQNLGVLALTFDRDYVTAKEWFRKALEIGPPSRAWLAEEMIPAIDASLAQGAPTSELRAIERRLVWND